MNVLKNICLMYGNKIYERNINEIILICGISAMLGMGVLSLFIVIGIKLGFVPEAYDGKKSLFLIIMGTVLLVGGLSLAFLLRKL